MSSVKVMAFKKFTWQNHYYKMSFIKGPVGFSPRHAERKKVLIEAQLEIQWVVWTGAHWGDEVFFGLPSTARATEEILRSMEHCRSLHASLCVSLLNTTLLCSTWNTVKSSVPQLPQDTKKTDGQRRATSESSRQKSDKQNARDASRVGEKVAERERNRGMFLIEIN